MIPYGGTLCLWWWTFCLIGACITSCGTCVEFQLSSYKRILYPRKLEGFFHLLLTQFLNALLRKAGLMAERPDGFSPGKPTCAFIQLESHELLRWEEFRHILLFPKQTWHILVLDYISWWLAVSENPPRIQGRAGKRPWGASLSPPTFPPTPLYGTGSAPSFRATLCFLTCQ